MQKFKTDRRHAEPGKIKQICSFLLNGNMSEREIGKHLAVSTKLIARTRKKLLGLTIEERSKIVNLTNQEIEKLFYGNLYVSTPKASSENKYIPNYVELANQCLERKVEIAEVYKEYSQKAQSLGKEAFSQSYFTRIVGKEIQNIKSKEPNYYYAQDHAYGMSMEIDFSGATYELPTFNGMVKCWMMILTWPASYYIYGEFVSSQSTEESCRVIGNAIRYFKNRIPTEIVCDNAKCFVIKHNGSEAILNKSFANFVENLGSCVRAAPVRHPQVKSSVEYSVNLCQKMMNHEECRNQFNQTRTIREHCKLLQEFINNRINKGAFKGSTTKTREYLFNTYELPVCRITNNIPQYEGFYKAIRVPRSYLIEVNKHEYSVPYKYIGEVVYVYIGNDEIIVKDGNTQIARHLRKDGTGRSIIEKHRPIEHQNIDTENAVYKTTDDVLKIAKNINENLYLFCYHKIEADRAAKKSVHSTIITCKSVIRLFKNSYDIEGVSEACKEILQEPSELWNCNQVKILTNQILERNSVNNNLITSGVSLIKSEDVSVHIRHLNKEDNQMALNNQESVEE